jgi:hypothetical protein
MSLITRMALEQRQALSITNIARIMTDQPRAKDFLSKFMFPSYR